MKAKFTLTSVLILTMLIYLFSGSTITSNEKKSMINNAAADISDTIQSGDDETFLIGALDCGYDLGFQNLDEVGFNAWHTYSAGNSGWTNIGADGDTLFAHIDAYRDGVQSKLQAVNSHGMKSIIHRPKIAMLCYGQRSDYQCETVSLNDDLWFYSFQSPDHVGADTNDTWQGQTQRVRYCQRIIQSTDGGAGWVVRRLKANTEQVFSYGKPSGIQGNDIKNWNIKPRIRIDTTFAHNNPNTLVCKIKVIGQDGLSVLRDADIRVRNFAPDNNYNGKYIEEYFFTEWNDTSSLNINGFWGDWYFNGARGNRTIDTNSNKIDIQIYWYGNCDMWIDYVRVDNIAANDLFNGVYDNTWLKWEAQDIACYNESAIKFYLELFAFGNIPCMSYVSRKLDSLAYLSCGKNITLTALMGPPYMIVVPWEERFSVMNPGHIIRNYVDKAGLTDILIACYPFYSDKQSFPYVEETFAKIPNTLPITQGNEVLANAVSPSEYDTRLQHLLDYSPAYFESGSTKSFPYDGQAHEWEGAFKWSMNLGDSISKARDIPFLYNGQSHLWYYAEGESHKEPTNEEIEMIANLSLTYGVRGILYFFYGWWPGPDTSKHNPYCLNNECFGRGFVDSGNIPRDSNAYGQNKWQMIKSQVQRIKKWEPYIMSFDNLNRHTYTYRLEDERNSLKSESYFADIVSYKPGTSNPTCNETDNPGGTAPTNLIYECNVDRYLQAATFEKPEESYTNYFMIVNRRCSPYVNDSTEDKRGGRRFIRVRFDSSHSSFAGFNNWKIIDLDSNQIVATFNKNVSSLLDLGWYMPGEGKLYKIAPVMQEGGTLVTDEECSGEFYCNGEVYNNGKTITIKPGTTINFANTSARIIMNGGEFRSGVNTTEETAPVYLKGKNGNFWKGLSLNECGGVEMFTTYFENISTYPVDSTYAATMIDCEYINIARCIFHADLDIKTGGILIYYTSELRTKEVFVNYNQFIMDAGDMPALSIMTAGYITFPLIIEGNEFESYSGNSSNAMFLSGVVGGAIKENQITGYKNGITMIWSSMDIYGNNFDGGDADSKGILSYASSNANLAPDGSTYTGGLNSISVEGENAKGIDVDNSFLLLDGGYNTFDIKNYEPGDAFHLSGAITDEAYADPLDATLNCFKVSGTDTVAVHNMTWTSTDPVNYNFIEYYCGDNESEGMIAFNLGNGNFDSLLTESSGSSGGFSNNHSEENVEIVSAENLEDSVSINIRKRDYERVSELCHDLLDDYIDSIESSVIVQKLYLADLRLDSSGNRISDLKSYLEMLVLNNPEKELLVKQAFYLIQKCKVALGQYESAMDGFEQIINQNPYSYEGLVASWDYAATSLLDSLHGSGGGIRNLEIGSNIDDDPKDKFDTKTFTKEDRKSIRTNVFNSYKTSRDKEAEIIKSLETKVAEAKATKSEKNELRTKRILSEIVKAKEPVNIVEHIKNVNENIQVLFGSASDNTNEKDIKSIIPTEYNLSQNYPNPFNPVTKIKFELPQEGKVMLIVYDLLGREILKLVNNELRAAGRHLVEFNGHNLSSGVYFYRLEVNDFVQTKRMILKK